MTRCEDTIIHEGMGHMKKSVFLVFGQNRNLKNQIHLALQKWGIESITIEDHGEIGLTTIENLELLAQRAEFAIVIFSGDDEGRIREPEKKEEDKMKLEIRARQNVIAELGYFTAKYGRGNVCTLYEKGVSIPSDFSGVTYISLENSWEMKLIQYLQNRGFSIKF